MKQKMKINFIFVFSLVLILILFNMCKRNTPEQKELPFSPLGFTTVFKLSASPNVISAGTSPEVSVVTVTLTKAGAALSGKTIIFEIYDELGNKIDLGYFEGNVSVASKTTGSNGMATVNYYGPLASKLPGSTVVYIRANVAGMGDETISGNAPIYIIADITEITFDVSANPNVIPAGTINKKSVITATLTIKDTPLADKDIILEICDILGNKINIGYFTGNISVITTDTNVNGVATADYYTPLSSELLGNVTVYIWATVAGEGEEFISNMAPVYIIGEIADATLSLSASPNVLTAETPRESSTITAALKTTAGAPLPNYSIIFEICDVAGNKISVGNFEGNELMVTKITDANGTITIDYVGPAVIAEETTIYIKGTVEWAGEDFISDMAPILIKVGT